MKNINSLSTLQIGALGVLLTQFELLKEGIESAHLTTDAGIDLVAYSPKKVKPVTIQVKANLKPKPGGGKGPNSVDWTVPGDSPAELFSFVDVSERRVWLVTKNEIERVAQQHPKSGKHHLYMYVVDPAKLKGKIGIASHVSNFDKYRLEKRIKELFFT